MPAPRSPTPDGELAAQLALHFTTLLFRHPRAFSCLFRYDLPRVGTSGARRARRRPFPHASPGWWRLLLHAARTSGAGPGKAVANVQPGLPRGAHVMVPPDRRHTTSYCSTPTWQGSTGWRTPTIANGTVPKAFEEQQERRNASNRAVIRASAWTSLPAALLAQGRSGQPPDLRCRRHRSPVVV